MHLGMTGRFSVKLPARLLRTTRDSLAFVVPSPLAGEGQGGGASATFTLDNPPTPNPSPRGGGESARRMRRGRAERSQEQLGEFTHDAGGDPKHDHIVFVLSNGAVVTYNDARRFGYMTLVPEAELSTSRFFRGLGVEPLGDELDAAYLAERARGRKADLKAFLMDQRIVAGLGNIYVCEALFRARLSPFKPAGRLATKSGKPMPAAERLAAAIKAVLGDAIRAGGSTLRDYRQAERRARRVPARLRRLRPRRRGLPEAGVPGQGAPQDAGRPLDLLLPGLPALNTRQRWSTSTWRTRPSSWKRKAASASSSSTGPTRSMRSTPS